MKTTSLTLAPIAALAFALSLSAAEAAPCMKVILTGTGGPPAFDGLAGPGTLVEYGDDANECRSVLMQFDAGRGTVMRLSQVGVQTTDISAVFLTHLHSDHLEGFSDMAQQRWMYGPTLPKMDVVCAEDAVAPAGYTVSCRKFVEHIDDAYMISGESAVRAEEMPGVDPEGPIKVLNVVTFAPAKTPEVVWQSGDVKVSAIASFHIPGHVSYRVDSPAGSVMISGDASNDEPPATRKTSTSDEVELLSKGVDVIVHSAVHPVLAPDAGSGMPAPIYDRQSNVRDIAAMAQRDGAKVLMLTHLGPSLGAESQGPWKIPGGPLTEADYVAAVLEGGFTGKIVVGTDLATVQLPLAE